MITITEALAEIKTIEKRIASKQEFVGQYLARQDNIKDPLEKDGGSATVLTREVQAIGDLEKRIVELRRGIQVANDKTQITLEGDTKAISDWLIWRREVAPVRKEFYNKLRKTLINYREVARKQGLNILGPNATAEKPSDIIVNLNEKDINQESERLENILGQLDGQLSLKNATVTIG